jgi:hypothetical protein
MARGLRSSTRLVPKSIRSKQVTIARSYPFELDPAHAVPLTVAMRCFEDAGLKMINAQDGMFGRVSESRDVIAALNTG